MGPWIYHWFWQDFWTPVWPNLVASLVVYIFVWLKMRSIQRMHEEQVKVQRELKALHIQHHHEHMAALDEIKTDSS